MVRGGDQETTANQKVPKATEKARWVEVDEQRVGVDDELLMGRNPECGIVIDDPMASRRHARIFLRGEEAFVEDLGSANGVYVAGKKIQEPTRIENGQAIVIGQQRLLFRTEVISQAPPAPRSKQKVKVTRTDEERSTGRANVLELLGGVAEKAVSLGDVAEAVRVLAPALDLVREESRTAGKLEPVFQSHASRYCLMLARATGEGRWVDDLIDLFAQVTTPLPLAAIDELYEVVRKVDAVNQPAFFAYLQKLRARADALSPSERFAQKRLEGLEKLIRLRGA